MEFSDGQSLQGIASLFSHHKSVLKPDNDGGICEIRIRCVVFEFSCLLCVLSINPVSL